MVEYFINHILFMKHFQNILTRFELFIDINKMFFSFYEYQ